MPKQAVLLLAHGTPETVEQIPEYLRNVTSGRPVPDHQHRLGVAREFGEPPQHLPVIGVRQLARSIFDG